MNVYLDIETIPNEKFYEEFLQAELENFKAPSTLTKAKACEDLGITGNDAKYTSKDDAIAKWEEKFAESKAPEVADEKFRKCSFNAAKGLICSIAWKVGDGEINTLTIDDACDKSLLESFLNQLREELGNSSPRFIGHYIGGFDLKFIQHRLIINEVNPDGINFPFYGRHDKDFYCTMIGWAGYKDTIKQDDLCKALGIEGKPQDIDGSKVWDFYKEGKIKEIAEYNADDVYKVCKIYKKLNFIGE